MPRPPEPGFEDRVRESFTRQRLMETLGARLVRVGAGEVDVELDVRDEVGQQHGFVHAGALASILDSAAGFAAYTLMPADAGVLSVEFKVNLLAPARGEVIVARGRVVRAGRTISVVTADAFGVEGGREAHVATFTGADQPATPGRPWMVIMVPDRTLTSNPPILDLHMRIFPLIPLALAALAACAPASPGASSPAPSAAAQDSTVIVLVRHAEKAGVAGEADPLLSAAGEARARALAGVLRTSGIDEIIVTQYRRTGATAAPIASALGIVPDTFSTRAPDHPAAVAAAARAHRGKTVLVVGHSNSVPAIITALGAGPMANLCEAEYSHLFVVVLKDGAAPRLERRTYGEPDPPGASNCPR